NVYRRSLSSGLNPKTPTCVECFLIKTRKDSAVHVSLSSSKLVKQPDARSIALPVREKFRQALLLKEDRLPSDDKSTDTYRLLSHSP
ncbi:hypothetical protein, partial [Tardiphaga sp.]|uniref:hypothetical protein n=1 Tax=Tardiphaga sp. TaxID=1926292 RepID=UPI0025F22112